MEFNRGRAISERWWRVKAEEYFCGTCMVYLDDIEAGNHDDSHDVVRIIPDEPLASEVAPGETRFAEFDDSEHPCNKWWQEHGQFMMAGGGRRQFIWACRGWIAREQLAAGVEITGDSLNESRTHPAEPQVAEAPAEGKSKRGLRMENLALREQSDERFSEIQRARRIIAELVAYKEEQEKFVRDMVSLINAMQEKELKKEVIYGRSK